MWLVILTEYQTEFRSSLLISVLSFDTHRTRLFNPHSHGHSVLHFTPNRVVITDSLHIKLLTIPYCPQYESCHKRIHPPVLQCNSALSHFSHRPSSLCSPVISLACWLRTLQIQQGPDSARHCTATLCNNYSEQ